jgi:hypothetical protein
MACLSQRFRGHDALACPAQRRTYHAPNKPRRYNQDQGAVKSRLDTWLIGLAVTLIAPLDMFAACQLARDRIELTKILCAHQI